MILGSILHLVNLVLKEIQSLLSKVENLCCLNFFRTVTVFYLLLGREKKGCRRERAELYTQMSDRHLSTFKRKLRVTNPLLYSSSSTFNHQIIKYVEQRGAVALCSASDLKLAGQLFLPLYWPLKHKKIVQHCTAVLPRVTRVQPHTQHRCDWNKILILSVTFCTIASELHRIIIQCKTLFCGPGTNQIYFQRLYDSPFFFHLIKSFFSERVYSLWTWRME